MSLFSGVVNFFSSAISTVGSWLVGATRTLISKLPQAIDTAFNAIGTISSVTSLVGDKFGLSTKDYSVSELGAKALQVGTRPKMQDETTSSYLGYLKNDVIFDSAKFEQMPKTEKIACEALGTTLIAKSIEEKTGVQMPPDFLYTIYKSKLNSEQTEKFISSFSNNGISSMGEFTRYISNDMNENEAIKIGTIIKDSIKSLNPGMSDDNVQTEIIEMKKNYFSEDI